jgi:CRP-like cAMP-binding protein
VPAEDLAPLAHVAEEVTYEPGEVLCTEGEVGDELFVIVSGKVRVTKGDKTLATLGPGDAVGELAVLDAEPRSATVTAADETEVLAIGSEEFYEILHEQSEIAEGVLRLLTARLREANLDARGRRSIV